MSSFFGKNFEEYQTKLYSRWSQVLFDAHEHGDACLFNAKPFMTLSSQHRVINVSPVAERDAMLVADQAQLPFANEQFKWVISYHAHESSSVALNLIELVRILLPGGYCVLFSVAPVSLLAWQISTQKNPLFNQIKPIAPLKIRRVMREQGMRLLSEYHIHYRACWKDSVFRSCAFLEILGPIVMPSASNIVISIWQKYLPGDIIDAQVCSSWGH